MAHATTEKNDISAINFQNQEPMEITPYLKFRDKNHAKIECHAILDAINYQ